LKCGKVLISGDPLKIKKKKTTREKKI